MVIASKAHSNSLTRRFNLVILALLLSAASSAAEKTKIAVVTEEWRPFNYTNSKGELVGRSTEKVKAILNGLNFDYEIQSYPWTRAMNMASRNENTLIYSIYRTPERESKYQWVCPLMAPVKVFLFRLQSRNDIQVKTLDDAKKYVISVNRNGSGHEFLRDNGFVEGINLDITSDPIASPRKLFAGRVDLLMQSEWEMTESVKRVGQNYAEVAPVLEVTRVNELEACMAFSPNTDKAIVKEVQRALDDYNNTFGLH